MKKKILLIEDEPDLVETTTFRLEKAGYEVIKAFDGKTALDLLGKVMPDLIILDLLLPKISGYDVCKKIKEDSKLKDVPIVLFTASLLRDISEKTKELGANDYIAKPFEAKELLEKVGKLI